MCKFTSPVLFFLFLFSKGYAQTVTNGDFNATGSNWTSCSNNTEAYAYETSYGGSNSSNHVAELDGNGTNNTSDDMKLCQSISGFVIGQQYTLDFLASRRSTSGTPNTVNITVTVNGGALSQTVSRNNTTFSLTPESFTFTATQTTHLLSFAPTFKSSLGMIVDNISIISLAGLPVELSSFNAKPIGCEVQLDWTMESAENFSHFELEKSYDGRNFARLAVLDATGITTRKAFHFTDLEPGKSNYYRLKQVDLDGSSTYSKTVVTIVEGCSGTAASLLVYPNPVQQNRSLFVDYSSNAPSPQLFVFNALGKMVRSIATNEAENTTAEVDISQLDPGIYFISDQFGKSVRVIVTD